MSSCTVSGVGKIERKSYVLDIEVKIVRYKVLKETFKVYNMRAGSYEYSYFIKRVEFLKLSC